MKKHFRFHQHWKCLYMICPNLFLFRQVIALLYVVRDTCTCKSYLKIPEDTSIITETCKSREALLVIKIVKYVSLRHFWLLCVTASAENYGRNRNVSYLPWFLVIDDVNTSKYTFPGQLSLYFTLIFGVDFQHWSLRATIFLLFFLWWSTWISTVIIGLGYFLWEISGSWTTNPRFQFSNTYADALMGKEFGILEYINISGGSHHFKLESQKSLRCE